MVSSWTKNVLESRSLILFWTVKNRIIFYDEVLFIQRLKSSFVCFLRLETNMFLNDSSFTLVSFYD